MKRMTNTLWAFGLCCGLGVMTAACGGNGHNTATDSTGVSTDSLMSTTNASGNASTSALPGDTTHSDSTSMTDSSGSRRP